MNSKKVIYMAVNIAVFFIAGLIFLYDYRVLTKIWDETGILPAVILMLTVILINGIKSARLFLALYGSDFWIGNYIRTYCKVTPVSLVIPYKLGEFYRMYCYGQLTGNTLKGIIVILLDRFMDTIALVTFILLIKFWYGGGFAGIVYLLFAFLIFILLAYYAYPNLYRFWKSYLLHAKATERKLKLLNILDRLNSVYTEIEQTAKGKGIILYGLSLAAWGIEIGSLVFVCRVFRTGNTAQMLSGYLNAVMSNGVSIPLKQFIFLSIVLLFVIYAVMTIYGKSCGRKKVL